MQNLSDKEEFIGKKCQSLQDAIKNTDAIILMMPTKEYKNLNFLEIQPKYVIDPWRIIDPTKISDQTNLIQIGIGESHSSEKESRGDTL